MTTTTNHDPHIGVSRFAEGNQTLFGKVGHWHSRGDGSAFKDWVQGTVEACETGLSDADLIAKIREADETFDPAPEFAGSSAVIGALTPAFGDIGTPSLVITKPERGGKRTCGCTHSESRHNASGACRTCDCSDFAILT